MKSNVMLLKSIGIKIVSSIFCIMLTLSLFIHHSLSIENILEILSISIVTTSVLIIIINRFFWKNMLKLLSKNKGVWTFFEQYECPILCEKYNCLIQYEWPEGTFGKKKLLLKFLKPTHL